MNLGEILDFFHEDLKLKNEHVIQELAKKSKILFLAKGALLIEEGGTQNAFPFLLSGILRGYTVRQDGQEITDCFVFRRGDTALGSNVPGEHSLLSVEAITDAKILLVPSAMVEEMMPDNNELLHIYNVYLLRSLDRNWKEKMILRYCSAKERYEWFLKDYPEVARTVSSKYIASFLGITPVSLSRIRQQLRREHKEFCIAAIRGGGAKR